MKISVEKLVEYYARQHSIDPAIVKAIVMSESSGIPDSDSGYARGLMGMSKIAVLQVNLIYGKDFTYEDMFNPAKNLEVGILYFKWLYDYFYNRYPHENVLFFTVMAYNWGIGNTVRWIKKTTPSNHVIDESVPKETKGYVFDFFWWYNYYKGGE